jgi:hypothetical protein
MSTPDDDGDGGDSPRRALLVALAAMAGVALLVGLAVGAAAITVLNGAGVGDTGQASGGSEESLYIPRYHPTQTAKTDDLNLPSPTAEESQSESPSEEPSPRTDRIKLFGAPQSVSPGERINFNGVYVDGEGVALQIQRKEGGVWVDFPVEATVRGGVFSTWIQTSHTGESPFRVLDETTNRVSNVVVITVG